ncbi:MAG: tryptophan-rich sensory protein [Caldilineaceae bacterium]|nr:tryptophan-rich sensory protein [Caldilineaceae bacterium]
MIPIWLFVVVGLLYYGLMGVILYRIQRHVVDKQNRRLLLGVGLSMMALNELWNYLVFGWQSTYYGFVGMVGFWVVVTAWLLLLWQRERVAARSLVIYWLWVIDDVVWPYALWQLN